MLRRWLTWLSGVLSVCSAWFSRGWNGGRAGLSRWWNRGPWQKALVIAAIPVLATCACCSSSLALAASPYGQQLAQEADATSTAQAVAAAQATQQAQIYALTHPAPTTTATLAPAATSTTAPTMTPLPTATDTPAPTATTPPAPAPTATPQPTCGTDGAPPNPWCYTFADTGKVIYNPPSDFCGYFDCIPSFWTSTNGYVEECADDTFSHSGGRSGSCSHHGGNQRPLYQP